MTPQPAAPDPSTLFLIDGAQETAFRSPPASLTHHGPSCVAALRGRFRSCVREIREGISSKLRIKGNEGSSPQQLSPLGQQLLVVWPGTAQQCPPAHPGQHFLSLQQMFTVGSQIGPPGAHAAAQLKALSVTWHPETRFWHCMITIGPVTLIFIADATCLPITLPVS